MRQQASKRDPVVSGMPPTGKNQIVASKQKVWHEAHLVLSRLDCITIPLDQFAIVIQGTKMGTRKPIFRAGIYGLNSHAISIILTIDNTTRNAKRMSPCYRCNDWNWRVRGKARDQRTFTLLRQMLEGQALSTPLGMKSQLNISLTVASWYYE